MRRTANLIPFLFVATALAQTPCEQLKGLSRPNTTITTAESVPAGPFQAPSPAPGAPAARPIDLPAHCRVAAVLTPSADSHIEMELWLPTDWNGKFEMVGNGGWAGGITYGSGTPESIAKNMSAALGEGYATASTDTGHQGNGADASFAIGHPEKLIDFAYRAVHETAVQSKALITKFYGRNATLSYWNGCSTGGRQGLTEAQKYPEDFDGIVAGAPAANWNALQVQTVDVGKQIHQGQPGNLSGEKIALLHKAVLAACDRLDGVRDGLLTDPRTCRFDPATLQCKSGDSPDCLTAAQVVAVRNVYRGPVSSKTNEVIHPGNPLGSEGAWSAAVGTPAFPIAESGMRSLVFGDPAWDYRNLEPGEALAKMNESGQKQIVAYDPNLKAFFDRGGKLLEYHGWSDQLIPAFDSINYYESVRKQRWANKLNDSYRLFLAPGMLHCGGGDGPNNFNPMAALERWRESKIAPDQIVASHVTNAAVDRTRPLCPYPQVAKYNGAGSINDASNFSCKAP